MKGVIVIGAGGHGREVAEALQCAAQAGVGPPPLGFIDDNVSLHGTIVNGLRVLGGWRWLNEVDATEIKIVCAIGSPVTRRAIVEQLKECRHAFHTVISPAAYVSPTAQVAAGAMILPRAVISSNCYLGPHAIVNCGATVSHDTRVGDYSTVNPGVHIAGNVSIGQGCFLGVGASVIHGVSIGDSSVVGGGAVVIGDLPSNVTAVGVPAKVIKTREEGLTEK